MDTAPNRVHIVVARGTVATALLSACSVLEIPGRSVRLVSNGLPPAEFSALLNISSSESRLEVLDYPSRRELPSYFLLQRLAMSEKAHFEWLMPGTLVRSARADHKPEDYDLILSDESAAPSAGSAQADVIQRLWRDHQLGLDAGLLPQAGAADSRCLSQIMRSAGLNSHMMEARWQQLSPTELKKLEEKQSSKLTWGDLETHWRSLADQLARP